MCTECSDNFLLHLNSCVETCPDDFVVIDGKCSSNSLSEIINEILTPFILIYTTLLLICLVSCLKCCFKSLNAIKIILVFIQTLETVCLCMLTYASFNEYLARVEDEKDQVLGIMLTPIIALSINIFLNAWVTRKHHGILGKKAEGSDDFLKEYHKWRRESTYCRQFNYILSYVISFHYLELFDFRGGFP